MPDVNTWPAPAPLPPAGWYDDPEGTGVRRYWDGMRWTDSRAPRLPAQVRTPKPPKSRPSGAAGDRTTALVVGILGIAGGVLLLVGLVPDFWDGWRMYEGAPFYHVAVEVLPGLAFILLGTLGLVGHARLAAPALLGMGLGCAFAWLHFPLQMIDNVGLGDMLFEAGGPGFYLQSLGLAAVVAGGVIGLVRLR